MGHTLFTLSDRKVITISGIDAEDFLNSSCTRDIRKIAVNDGGYAVFSSPRGKFLYDCFICRSSSDKFFMDCFADNAEELLEMLNNMILRSNVSLEISNDLVVVYFPSDEYRNFPGVIFRDERHPDFKYRGIFSPKSYDELVDFSSKFLEKRVKSLVMEGGYDLLPGKCFVTDIRLDVIGGVSKNKGCYIGQEVIGRIIRKENPRRFAICLLQGDSLPNKGDDLFINKIKAGFMGGCYGSNLGLCALREDFFHDTFPVIDGGFEIVEVNNI